MAGWLVIELLGGKGWCADYVRRAGRAGRVAGDTALRYFQQLDINTRRRLFNIYKYDFILFGYDWEQYFR